MAFESLIYRELTAHTEDITFKSSCNQALCRPIGVVTWQLQHFWGGRNSGEGGEGTLKEFQEKRGS